MTTTIDGSNESTFAAGVTCTSLNGGQLAGRRNIVINGGMKVAQRSTSVTGLGATTGYYTLDRFRTPMSTSGRFTMAQVADGPAHRRDQLWLGLRGGPRAPLAVPWPPLPLTNRLAVRAQLPQDSGNAVCERRPPPLG